MIDISSIIKLYSLELLSGLCWFNMAQYRLLNITWCQITIRLLISNNLCLANGSFNAYSSSRSLLGLELRPLLPSGQVT
jgi:hypothetical protein